MNLIEELLKPSIIEIHGPAGSGKTNLCIHIAGILLNKGYNVYFINADKGLSVERIHAMIGEKNMEKIKISYVKSSAELEKNIEEVQGILVVDPITYFYRLERNMAKLEHLLKKIKEKSLPSILTNQVYDNIEIGETMPLARELMEKYCDIIIELRKENESHVLEILKPKRKTLLFTITRKGIEFFRTCNQHDSRILKPPGGKRLESSGRETEIPG